MCSNKKWARIRKERAKEEKEKEKDVIVVPKSIRKLLNETGMTEKDMWNKIKILCIGFKRASRCKPLKKPIENYM